MTREEERLKAAYEIADTNSDDYYTQVDYFIKGAEWADKHPRKGLVDIEKAVKWIFANFPSNSGISIMMHADDFRKAMEE